jgi:hypothetical protein
VRAFRRVRSSPQRDRPVSPSTPCRTSISAYASGRVTRTSIRSPCFRREVPPSTLRRHPRRRPPQLPSHRPHPRLRLWRSLRPLRRRPLRLLRPPRLRRRRLLPHRLSQHRSPAKCRPPLRSRHPLSLHLQQMDPHEIRLRSRAARGLGRTRAATPDVQSPRCTHRRWARRPRRALRSPGSSTGSGTRHTGARAVRHRRAYRVVSDRPGRASRPRARTRACAGLRSDASSGRTRPLANRLTLPGS